jgi:Icc-related predicted phosphoesterase
VALFGKRKSREPDEPALGVYYASDVHGADRLWRKFLGAGKFYDCTELIMGGDLIGKAVVPIERRADGTHRAKFLGAERVLKDQAELDELIDAIRFNGFYPWVASAEEIAPYGTDAASQSELFDRVVREDFARWVALADERTAANDNHLFIIAGNDDPWFVDEMLGSSEHLRFCDDTVVQVGTHEMISFSYANPTPWDSPRELDEDELYRRLKALADQLEAPRRAIFNLHVPPYDSGLDTATELDADLRPVYRGGQPVEIPVGSRAVRQIIEEHQPLLSLHGHIHESRGEARIGDTLALNSGSEYNTGRLHGVVVQLGEERVLSHQFVVG